MLLLLLAQRTSANLLLVRVLNLNGFERALKHRTIKHAIGRKTKVEYLLAFCGYGPEHIVWQEEVNNCDLLVSDDWASKQHAEHLAVLLCHLLMHMESSSMFCCWAVPPMLCNYSCTCAIQAKRKLLATPPRSSCSLEVASPGSSPLQRGCLKGVQCHNSNIALHFIATASKV